MAIFTAPARHTGIWDLDVTEVAPLNAIFNVCVCVGLSVIVIVIPGGYADKSNIKMHGGTSLCAYT
jgi:hypothetical protein